MKPALIPLMVLMPCMSAWALDAGLPVQRVDAGKGKAVADAAKAKPKVAKGPPPAAKMECAPNPVRIGEPLVCTLTIIHRNDVSITVTSPEDVRALPSSPAQAHGNGKLKSLRALQIMPASMKKVHVKDLVVVWTEADGSVGEYSIPAQRVVVQSVMTEVKEPKPKTYGEPQGEPQQFWGRHGPTPYVVTNWPLIITLLVLVGGGIGALIGIWLNRWLRGRRGEAAPWVDPRPAHVIALEGLQYLVAARLPEQGLYETYYVRLSEIIRGYLKRRYGINGLEMTSEEIRLWTETEQMEESARTAITDFLYETDIVKFANVKPSPAELDTVTRQARGLIALTQNDESDEPQEDVAEETELSPTASADGPTEAENGGDSPKETSEEPSPERPES